MRLKDIGVSRALVFAPLGGASDNGRRIPLGEDGHVTKAGEPLAQQVNLGALAGTVDALHDYQPPRILAVVRMVAETGSHGEVSV